MPPPLFEFHGGIMIKVGDIIDGKRVTRVYTLCGGTAYQSEPVKQDVKPEIPKEPVEKKKVGRKKKVQ